MGVLDDGYHTLHRHVVGHLFIGEHHHGHGLPFGHAKGPVVVNDLAFTALRHGHHHDFAHVGYAQVSMGETR